MTMFSKHQVINNLRDRVKELEGRLEAIKTYYFDLKDRGLLLCAEAHLKEFEKILEAEGH